MVRLVGASLGGRRLQRCNRHVEVVPSSIGGNITIAQQRHPAVGWGVGVHRSTLPLRVGGAKLSWADLPSQVPGADTKHGTEPLCERTCTVLIYSPQRMSEWTGLDDENRERWRKKRIRKRRKMRRKKTQDTGSHTPA